jgi:hypothetical protein
MNAQTTLEKVGILCTIAALVIAGIASRASAAEPVGLVISKTGQVNIQRQSRLGWQPVALKQPVFLEDVLRTEKGGRAQVLLKDDTLVNLGEESEVAVSEFIVVPDKDLRKATFNMVRGVSRFIVKGAYPDPESRLGVQTPTAVLGVRGTTFYVLIVSESETLAVSAVDAVVVRHLLEGVEDVVVLTPGLATRILKDYVEPPWEADPELLAELIRDTQVLPPGFSTSASEQTGQAADAVAKGLTSGSGQGALNREAALLGILQDVIAFIPEDVLLGLLPEGDLGTTTASASATSTASATSCWSSFRGRAGRLRRYAWLYASCLR